MATQEDVSVTLLYNGRIGLGANATFEAIYLCDFVHFLTQTYSRHPRDLRFSF